MPEAVRLLTAWNAAYTIDFCEAPVRADPIEGMQEVRRRVPIAICANEGLSRPADVLRMIRDRGAECRFIPTVITTTCGVAYTFKTISPMTSS